MYAEFNYESAKLSTESKTKHGHLSSGTQIKIENCMGSLVNLVS